MRLVYFLLHCFEALLAGRGAGAWSMVRADDNGLILPDVPWSFTSLTSPFSMAEKGLLHFGYFCLIVGLCLFMGLFAFVQSLYSRDRTYRYWAFYLWSNFILFFTALDFNFRLGILDAQNRPWISVVQYIVQLSYLLFISSFLEIKRFHLPTHKLVRLLIGVMVVGAVYTTWAVAMSGHYRGLVDVGDAFTFVTDLLILLLFIRIVKLGIPQTRLLIIGSLGALTAAVLAAIVDQFNLTHVGGYWLDPMIIFSVGILFELTFFSLALSQRTRLVQLENQRLQKDYTHTLEQDLAVRVATIQEQRQQIDDERLQRLTNDFNQKLGETEMAALRAQMNPHFIFNCLNSIQYFTAQNDAETASDYLTKFSRLIRLVLENSRSERVTLTNELETLRLYIEMEAMRFGQKVRYSIIVEPTVDVESIQIPPLLIQPFVENAIWHGLMHKPDGGSVTVAVQQPQDHLLEVSITDDGVGRIKAAAYKSKSATSHKSFGMKVTAERIDLINQMYHTHTQVRIDDLTDAAGQPTGTRVTVTIPI